MYDTTSQAALWIFKLLLLRPIWMISDSAGSPWKRHISLSHWDKRLPLFRTTTHINLNPGRVKQQDLQLSDCVHICSQVSTLPDITQTWVYYYNTRARLNQETTIKAWQSLNRSFRNSRHLSGVLLTLILFLTFLPFLVRAQASYLSHIFWRV